MDILKSFINMDSNSLNQVTAMIPETFDVYKMVDKLTKCWYKGCNEYATTFVIGNKPVCHQHWSHIYYSCKPVCNSGYCLRPATYGYFNPEYCSDHRKCNMVYIFTELCKYKGICEWESAYMNPYNYRNKRCYTHREPGMFSKQEFKCKHSPDCNNIADYYNITDPNKKPYKCRYHSETSLNCVPYR